MKFVLDASVLYFQKPVFSCCGKQAFCLPAVRARAPVTDCC